MRQVRGEGYTMPSQKTLDDFVALVVSGKHDEALERFYTEDATMQDNLGDVRKGRDALDRKSTRLNSSHSDLSRMPSSA